MTPRRILVIEDDPANAELVAGRLKAAGMVPILAGTGREGLARVWAEPFAAVLLDLRLPDMDGLEVLTRIRAHAGAPPVIIMTAHGSPAVAAKAKLEGAAAYMLKPLDRRELLETVERALKA